MWRLTAPITCCASSWRATNAAAKETAAQHDFASGVCFLWLQKRDALVRRRRTRGDDVPCFSGHRTCPQQTRTLQQAICAFFGMAMAPRIRQLQCGGGTIGWSPCLAIVDGLTRLPLEKKRADDCGSKDGDDGCKRCGAHDRGGGAVLCIAQRRGQLIA
jgi:hypothetical protein